MSDVEPTAADEGDVATAGKASGGGRDMLEIVGLTKIYPDGTLAVDDVDFSIAEGDFCVLIGPSGCGKSTTLHSIVGKFPITEGKIVLDGEDITGNPTYERDIGLVFQDFQLFPHLTAIENITYGLDRMEVSGSERQERVDRVLELMRIEDLQDRKPEELSAGQKQLVAVARSLVLEPKLLLLDEPLGDMDYKLQKRMERELLRIHREFDTTFVYVTHDQTQAMRLADQIVVMNGGRIEQSDSVENVYNAPATAFVSTFVGDSNVFTGDVVDLSNDETIATIETPFGAFQASTSNLRSPPDSVVGDWIPFSVRPQHMELSDSMDNRLTCDVVDVIQQPGSGTQIVLRAEGEGGKTTELQFKSSTLLEPTEDEVVVGWDAERATLLEEISVVPNVDLEKDLLGE